MDHDLVLYKPIEKERGMFLLQLEQSAVLHTQPTGAAATGFNPFIYGNDVDSVDVATRVAMVSVLFQCGKCYSRYLLQIEDVLFFVLRV
jgi:hypothetical protein